MIHDCGLVTPSKIGDEIRTKVRRDDLSPEARHSLRVLICTPGFSNQYLALAFGKNMNWIFDEVKLFDPKDYQDEALANWNSITRDDALALIKHRKGTRFMPVICTVYMLDDAHSRSKTQPAIAAEWGSSTATIGRGLKQTPFIYRYRSLPDWFREHIPT